MHLFPENGTVKSENNAIKFQNYVTLKVINTLTLCR